MPIKFKCPSCSAVLQVNDSLAGKKGRCPKCQQIITVPTESAPEGGAPAPAPAPAGGGGGAAVAKAPSAASKPRDLPDPPKAQLLMTQNVGPVMVVTIMEPRITEPADIREVGEGLMELLERQEKPQIVLDFSKVTYLPSAMIGKLTAMHKTAKKYKGSLKMCSIAPGVHQIFKITKLDKVFEIFPDMNTAMNSFKGLGKLMG